MQALIFKILSVILCIAGIVISAAESSFLIAMFTVFFSVIIYQLAVIMEHKK